MSDEEYSYDRKDKKSRSAKTGRRAKKTAQPPPDILDEPEDDMAADDDIPGPTSNKQAVGSELDDAPPKPSRRMGGWGSEPSSATSRNRNGDELEDIEDFRSDDDLSAPPRYIPPSERLRPMSAEKKEEDSDSDPDIPIIPDLEDQNDDDLTHQIAMAPNVAVNRVATFRELDNDLLRHAAFLTLDNEIDMKLLSKSLSPETDVQEEDVGWDWDRLFTEVTSELLTEWEHGQQNDEETAIPVA